ncbi:hypothetical protein OPV22_016854 [Ensete ventricosum]|uniref:Uncharacterized protein n=1 Tax=Ensete ventricosum TaxID=4639 RepID=A0AAV8QWH7_ENSVE|nr:hypothetical protein OPV22_016854 [Ensete ventricosum]
MMYLEYVVRPSLEQSEQRDAQDEQVRGVEKGPSNISLLSLSGEQAKLSFACAKEQLDSTPITTSDPEARSQAVLLCGCCTWGSVTVLGLCSSFIVSGTGMYSNIKSQFSLSGGNHCCCLVTQAELLDRATEVGHQYIYTRRNAVEVNTFSDWNAQSCAPAASMHYLLKLVVSCDPAASMHECDLLNRSHCSSHMVLRYHL